MLLRSSSSCRASRSACRCVSASSDRVDARALATALAATGLDVSVAGDLEAAVRRAYALHRPLLSTDGKRAFAATTTIDA